MYTIQLIKKISNAVIVLTAKKVLVFFKCLRNDATSRAFFTNAGSQFQRREIICAKEP